MKNEVESVIAENTQAIHQYRLEVEQPFRKQDAMWRGGHHRQSVGSTTVHSHQHGLAVVASRWLIFF